MTTTLLQQLEAAFKSFAPDQTTRNVPMGLGVLDSGRFFVMWTLAAGGPIFDTLAEAMAYIVAHQKKSPHPATAEQGDSEAA